MRQSINEDRGHGNHDSQRHKGFKVTKKYRYEMKIPSYIHSEVNCMLFAKKQRRKSKNHDVRHSCKLLKHDQRSKISYKFFHFQVRRTNLDSFRNFLVKFC